MRHKRTIKKASKSILNFINNDLPKMFKNSRTYEEKTKLIDDTTEALKDGSIFDSKILRSIILGIVECKLKLELRDKKCKN